MHPSETVRLLVACRDRPGLIAAITAHIAQYQGNIVRADQHTDHDTGEFFMRVEITRESIHTDRREFEEGLATLANSLAMSWRLEWSDRQKRIAILVSKDDHCLSDLLWRWRAGELAGDISLVVSNHERTQEIARMVKLPFHFLPVTPDSKPEQESRLLAILHEAEIDLVVLARYMQILSSGVVDHFPGRIINIHHSFLPAFPGAHPYHRAHERGVKIIGATSHYVTEDLDEGPIIAQTTEGVDHRHTVRDLIRKGRDLERLVLARAVRLHLEDRVLIAGGKTVVFD